METVDLQNRGVVLSYTFHHMPSEEFEAPLFLALVKLDDDAVVLCTGNISENSEIKINQDVFLGKDEAGRLILSLSE